MDPRWHDVPQRVQDKTGIELEVTDYTDNLLIANSLAPPGGHWCSLFGPYKDKADPEPNIFVVVSIVGDHETFQLLVQDCDDDFLNSTAEGAEKYNVGVVWM